MLTMVGLRPLGLTTSPDELHGGKEPLVAATYLIPPSAAPA